MLTRRSDLLRYIQACHGYKASGDIGHKSLWEERAWYVIAHAVERTVLMVVLLWPGFRIFDNIPFRLGLPESATSGLEKFEGYPCPVLFVQ
jgi:hypothetical protein